MDDPLTAAEVVPHTLDAFILGNELTSFYFKPGSEPGISLYVEQRSWLSYLGYDGLDYRKREKLAGTLESLQRLWCLLPRSFSHGGTTGLQLRTTVLRSDMLFAWLFKKFRDLQHRRMHDRAALCGGCFSALSRHVRRGATLVEGERPAVVVAGKDTCCRRLRLC